MCCSKGLLKRLLPFFLTFAVGLFIASFFVSIAAPNFQFNRGLRRHRQYDQMMQFENQRLKEDNLRFQKQLSDQSSNGADFDIRYTVPPPPPLPPVPPTVKAQTIPYRVR